MTNVLSFPIEFEGTPYVIMVTDSQSSYGLNGGKAGTNQKLAKRGKVLIASSGRGDIGNIVKEQLINEEIHNPYHAARRALEIANHSFENPNMNRFKPENDDTIFVVAGLASNGQPEIYEVPVRFHDQKEGVYRVPMSSQGSGAQKVGSAWRRDSTTGNGPNLTDITEAILTCFSMGKAAYQDNWVDDKLQYGIAGPKSTTLLLHPEVIPISPKDAICHLEDLTHMKLDPEKAKKIQSDARNAYESVGLTIDNFYNALTSQLTRLYDADRTVNYVHGQLKVGKSDESECKKALSLRIDEKQHT
ncbi:MAG: hypothetical protein KJ922_05800, partial [Nanoarchaeota archaeon]|nr:hypothetical protein [Nanoarchaeota archaeon]